MATALRIPASRSSFGIDVSDDTIREHAYLVERGVRPLALIGHCSADQPTRLAAISRVEQLAPDGAIAFAVETKDGIVDVGFASHVWAIDLYRWAASEQENAVPDEHRHRILGLLLGYAPDAIDRFEQRRVGREFTE